MSKLAAVRIRGKGGARKEIEDTLQILRLTRPNYCTIVRENSSNLGMLGKAKELVTWGPIEP
ncbi:MAG: uL30 family ribosomal protein, partial [Candidatus Aenigmatarchaeota archaeon]